VCYDQKIVATRYHWRRPRLLSKFPCTVTFARSPRKIRFALHARGTPRASPLPDDMMAVGSGRHHPKPTTFSPAEAVPAVRAIHTSGSAPTLSFPEKRKKEKKGKRCRKFWLSPPARSTANRDRRAASLSRERRYLLVTLTDRILLPIESNLLRSDLTKTTGTFSYLFAVSSYREPITIQRHWWCRRALSLSLVSYR
jgi:hypothetical protein